MSKPNFIIVGFPKCGSTALHYYLDSHPEIYMPKQKELHYFSQNSIASMNKGPGDLAAKVSQIKTKASYYNNFNNVNKQLAIGETSPSYINYPENFSKIKKELNDPKIIILIRDPIKRAYSNYLHLLREGRENESFQQGLLLENKRLGNKYSDFWGYKFNSIYFSKISKAEKCFSKVLVLTQEDLNKHTQITLQKVYKFLGVDEFYKSKKLKNRYNVGGIYKKNLITQFFFRQSKFKQLIKKLVPISPWIKDIKNNILKKHHYEAPKIDEKVETELIKVFSKDVNLLSKKGIDISSWNTKFHNHE